MSAYQAKLHSAESTLLTITEMVSFLHSMQIPEETSKESYIILVEGISEALNSHKKTCAEIDEIDSRLSEVSSDK